MLGWDEYDVSGNISILIMSDGTMSGSGTTAGGYSSQRVSRPVPGAASDNWSDAESGNFTMTCQLHAWPTEPTHTGIFFDSISPSASTVTSTRTSALPAESSLRDSPAYFLKMVPFIGTSLDLGPSNNVKVSDGATFEINDDGWMGGGTRFWVITFKNAS
jgi:hypothetical protein